MKPALVALLGIAILALGVPFAVAACEYDERTEAERFAELYASAGDFDHVTEIEFEDGSVLEVRVAAQADSGAICTVFAHWNDIWSERPSRTVLVIDGSLYCPES